MEKHTRIHGTITERLYRRVAIDPVTGCFNWLGAVNPKGYGIMGIADRKTGSTHRLSYKLWFGPIPDGCEIHHECRNVRCVNPGHLTAVPATEHPDAFGPVNRAKNRCPRGHPYGKKRNKKGARFCPTCRNAATIAYWAKRGGREAQRKYLQEWRFARGQANSPD